MSDPIKLSIYTYLFNSSKAWDLDATVANFLSFADEVVIATLADQEDDTLDRLLAHTTTSGDRLKVVVVPMDIKTNNRFDGDLKTAALQQCTHPIRIIADCDERFVPSQRPIWDNLAIRLLSNPHMDGWLIPVIDMYGARHLVRADQSIGVKMRMHKDTVVRRGVPRFAERGGGLIDTSQSDTTEALLADGNLARFGAAHPQHLLHPSTCAMLDAFVWHEGFLNLSRRAELGRTFWKRHWELRSGHDEKVATSLGELLDVPTVPHNLPIP